MYSSFLKWFLLQFKCFINMQSSVYIFLKSYFNQEVKCLRLRLFCENEPGINRQQGFSMAGKTNAPGEHSQTLGEHSVQKSPRKLCNFEIFKFQPQMLFLMNLITTIYLERCTIRHHLGCLDCCKALEPHVWHLCFLQTMSYNDGCIIHNAYNCIIV